MREHDDNQRTWIRIGDVLCSNLPSDLVTNEQPTTHIPPPPSVPSSAGVRTALSKRLCPHCGREQGTVQLWLPWRGQTDYWWETCPCRIAAWAEDERRKESLTARYYEAQADEKLIAEGVRRMAHLTMEQFEPQLLTSDTATSHPCAVATTWFNRILALPHGNYRDEHCPPAALYFYSPGKGRGKTHLAAAVANLARQAGKSVAFVEEHAWLEARWGRPLAEVERMTIVPGERTWLTVIDDLGQRAKASDAVADAWYALFNRRSPLARWTIITSNRTPEELRGQGTINDATYSRLVQMIRKQIVLFRGMDRRLT